MNASSKKAMNVCLKLQKASENTKEMLRKLYPTTTGVSSGSKFCPTEKSIAEKQQAKKKPAIKGRKPCSLLAHLLPHITIVVPKGEQ